MKKLILPIISVALLSACGGDSAPTSEGGQKAASHVGRFDGTIGDKPYTLDVSCYSMDKEGQSTFASSLAQASKGKTPEGLYVRGDELKIGDKVSLSVTLVDGDNTYSNRTMTTWKKSTEGMSGEGELWIEDDPELARLPLIFEVTCR